MAAPDPFDRLVSSMEKLSNRLTETTTALGVLHTDGAVAKEQRQRLVRAEADHESRIRANERTLLDAAAAAAQREVLVKSSEDHETRIRANERAVWKWAGVMSALMVVLGIVIKFAGG